MALTWTDQSHGKMTEKPARNLDDLELRLGEMLDSPFRERPGAAPNGVNGVGGNDSRPQSTGIPDLSRDDSDHGSDDELTERQRQKRPVNQGWDADTEESEDDNDEILNMHVGGGVNRAQLPQVSKIYSKSEVRKNTNRLGRVFFKKAFGVKTMNAVFAKDGVAADVLEQYLARTPNAQQPNVKDARLDKCGLTVKELMRSPWNRTLIRLLADGARTLAAGFPNGQYGARDFNWEGLFKDRINKVLRRE
ncbi:hypothetical protein FB446DRAFT_710237, partial [Lentinula raphanica]